MGGTTAKAGVIYDGEVLMTGSALIGGYATGLPVQIPMIDIQEVGTGGGSIARVEAGGACVSARKAPARSRDRSATASGGDEPTVTDANLVLGRLGADRFLGGEMRLDLDGARKRATRPQGRQAARPRSDRRPPTASCGSPPPRCRTWCAGSRPNAASMPPTSRWSPMAARARCMPPWSRANLRIAKVIIPHAPGHFSAYGMLFADLRRDFVNTWFKPLADVSFDDDGDACIADMETARRRDDLARQRLDVTGVTVQRCADMRYVGQEHAVTVDLPLELFERQDRDGIKQRFDAVHEIRYGYSAPAEKAEIVSLRSASTGLMRKPAVERIASRRGRAARMPPSAARGRSISPSAGACRHADLSTAPNCRPATASPARR